MKQIVEHKKLGPVKGLLLILGLAAVLVLLNYVAINLIAMANFDAKGEYRHKAGKPKNPPRDTK